MQKDTSVRVQVVPRKIAVFVLPDDSDFSFAESIMDPYTMLSAKGLHWLKLAYNGSHNSLDNAVLHVDRFHGAVCRLKPNAVTFAIKPFQCGKGIVEQGHNHFSVTW